MPALDFPTSPTNGQVYGQYTYDSTKGAWRVTSPSTVNNAIISPTAPSSPVAGNIWYNSTDGNTYVYYNDGDTSQWVQLKSDATLSSTLGNRVTSLETTPSGLVPIIPSSVVVNSGSASVDAGGKVTFTGASTITLNNVFNASYDNYKMLQAFNCGTTGTTGYKLISGGAELSAASYWFREIYVDNTANTIYASFLATQTQGRLAFAAANVYESEEVNINSPFLTQRTNFSTITGRTQPTPTGVLNWSGYDGTNSAESIKMIFPGTATGTFKIYGYR